MDGDFAYLVTTLRELGASVYLAKPFDCSKDLENVVHLQLLFTFEEVIALPDAVVPPLSMT